MAATIATPNSPMRLAPGARLSKAAGCVTRDPPRLPAALTAARTFREPLNSTSFFVLSGGPAARALALECCYLKG
jgi:hypothetical protein